MIKVSVHTMIRIKHRFKVKTQHMIIQIIPIRDTILMGLIHSNPAKLVARYAVLMEKNVPVVLLLGKLRTRHVSALLMMELGEPMMLAQPMMLKIARNKPKKRFVKNVLRDILEMRVKNQLSVQKMALQLLMMIRKHPMLVHQQEVK